MMETIRLNPSQRNYFRAGLLSFEKALRLADRLLVDGDEQGHLYTHRLRMTASQRHLARQKVSRALTELSGLTRQLGFEPVEEDPARLIVAEMSVSWANLMDSRSSRLRGYGS